MPSTVPSDFECEHPAQLSRGDALIGGYLDKSTAFSGAEWCVGTAQMTLKDGPRQNRCAARICKVNFESEHPARCSRRDPLIGGYLDKTTAFSGAEWCVLRDRQGPK